MHKCCVYCARRTVHERSHFPRSPLRLHGDPCPDAQASPGDHALPSEQLLQRQFVDELGLPPFSAPPLAQDGPSMQDMPVGYLPLPDQPPQGPPDLRQPSTGSATSGERWGGYDASGSSGTRRSGSGSGHAAVSMTSHCSRCRAWGRWPCGCCPCKRYSRPACRATFAQCGHRCVL